ncbi:MAG: hypothetical protein ABWZ76_00460 [Acidimicrobiales bacterium]
MAVTDADPKGVSVDELGRLDASTAAPERPGARWSLSWPARVLLAALSLGAASIHLAMVPSHASEWLAEGVGFALAGWFQVVTAIAVVARPSQLALRAACVLNVLFVAAWAWTRAVGAPFGPEADIPHAAGFVDITCVALELAIVVVAGVALVRPAAGSNLPESWCALVSVMPVGVLALATVAIVSPSAADHGHSATTAAGGHDHGHDPGSHAAHEAAEIAYLFPDGDDRGWPQVSNGGAEHGAHEPDVPLDTLDPAVRATYTRQLNLTLEAVRRYPTVRDAEAAGYRRVGRFRPGLGAHYRGGVMDRDGVLTADEIAQPSFIIYDGTQPDSPIAGFMYSSAERAADTQGFAGPNDRWHSHSRICIRPAADGAVDDLGGDGSITQDDCIRQGGTFIEEAPDSLVHVWTVPGYTSPVGVFSHANPAIKCPDGTYHDTDPACATK